MNLPTVDGHTLCCSDDYEQRVIDLFDHNMPRQVFHFATCANITIDLVFQKMQYLGSEQHPKDYNFC